MNPSETPTNPAPVPNPTPNLPSEPATAPSPTPTPTPVPAPQPASISGPNMAPAFTSAAAPNTIPSPTSEIKPAPISAAGGTKKKSPLILIVLVVVLLALVVLGIIFVPKFFKKKTPEEAAKQEFLNKNFLISVQQEDLSWKLMDSDGNYVLEDYSFDNAVSAFKNGVAKVSIDDKWAFMTEDGKLTKSCDYSDELYDIAERNRWFACGTLYNEKLEALTPEDVDLEFEYDYDQDSRWYDVEFGFNKLYFQADNYSERTATIYDEDGKQTASIPYGGYSMDLEVSKIKDKERANDTTYCVAHYYSEGAYYALFNCETGKMLIDFQNENYISPVGENLFVLQNQNSYDEKGIYVKDDQIIENKEPGWISPYSHDYYSDQFANQYYVSYDTNEVFHELPLEYPIDKKTITGYSYLANGKYGFRNNKNEDIVPAEYDKLIFPEYEAERYFDLYGVHVAVGKKDKFSYVIDLDTGDILYTSPTETDSETIDTDMVFLGNKELSNFYLYNPIIKKSADFYGVWGEDKFVYGWGFFAIKTEDLQNYDYYNQAFKKVYTGNYTSTSWF